MVRVGMTSAALISFYVLLLLLYVQTRPALDADNAVPAPRSIEPPRANHSRPVRLRRLLSRNLSATVERWADSRLAAKQPLRLVVSGLTSAGTEWLAAVLQIILEEALAAHGKPPVHLVTDACREKKYCILNAGRFTPDALAAADAVFTAHRDVRDVLLYMHAVGAVEKAARGAKLASALGKLEREFGVYRAWRAHACRDVRHEDVVGMGSAREIQALISALGLQRSVDLLAVVRRVGQWTRTTQQARQQQQRSAARAGWSALHSLLVESVGVYRLVLGGPLQKGAAAADAALQADMRNVTAFFGGWLLEQGFEQGFEEEAAAGGAPASCYEFSPLSSTVYFVRFGCFVKRGQAGVTQRVEAQAKIAGRPYRYMSWGRAKYYGARAWYGLASGALGDHYVKEFEGCAVAEGPAHARQGGALVSSCCPPPAWCPTSVDGLRWDDAPSEVTA